eukprot:4426460-Pyramimonas_sp.AAC.1
MASRVLKKCRVQQCKRCLSVVRTPASLAKLLSSPSAPTPQQCLMRSRDTVLMQAPSARSQAVAAARQWADGVDGLGL